MSKTNDEQSGSAMVAPSRLREPTVKRELDGRKIAYLSSLLLTIGGLVLMAIHLSWKVALSAAVLEGGAAVFFMTLLTDVSDVVHGGRRN